MIGLLFWLLTALSCLYAAVFGGRDGRWAAFLIILASLLTIPAAMFGGRYGRFELDVFLVDTSLLLGLYMLAMASRRWWPLWMTGFHLVAVTSHLSAAVATGFVADAYLAAASFWAIPMSIAMIVGVTLDHRATREGNHTHDRVDRSL
ncbi:hypothetical protein [Sphingomonas sp. 37zxx]|uniref:hypothetical protein n=1 Tax=Sphingomonas sp. 37zxx TaxID=1550073 RepID=UPI00053BFC32|nr:hypothetical protein [Sphingomonas sp. 37zxx]